MKKRKEQITLAILLLVASTLLYLLNYAIFKDAHHIFMFLTEDLAFIPIEVLVVTLIIDRLLENREKEHRIDKLNILIGLFFDEFGNELLKEFVTYDNNIEGIRGRFILNNNVKNDKYKDIKKLAKSYDYKIEKNKINLEKIEGILVSKKDELIKLLENPVLLEHETFTDLLQALFHVYNEITTRKKLHTLTNSDEQHIKGDLERVYKLLSYEWIIYMEYLQREYPYLFRTAQINNPYDHRGQDEIENSINASR